MDREDYKKLKDIVERNGSIETMKAISCILLDLVATCGQYCPEIKRLYSKKTLIIDEAVEKLQKL